MRRSRNSKLGRMLPCQGDVPKSRSSHLLSRVMQGIHAEPGQVHMEQHGDGPDEPSNGACAHGCPQNARSLVIATMS